MYERLLPMILILASGLAWRQLLPVAFRCSRCVRC